MQAARGIAGALTCILHMGAYATSAEMAGEVGPFPAFKRNADAMLRGYHHIYTLFSNLFFFVSALITLKFKWHLNAKVGVLKVVKELIKFSSGKVLKEVNGFLC